MGEINHKCCICEATFQPGTLKDGKCPICVAAYPTVKNRKEAMLLNQPQLNMGDEITVERVRQIIQEEIAKNNKIDMEIPDWMKWAKEQFEKEAIKKAKKEAALKKAREVKATKEVEKKSEEAK
jgi:hypothetical protein